MKFHFFTLTELIAVLAIMLVVGGLAVGQLGRIPAFASLEKSVSEVERLFSYASSLAVTRGRTVGVEYSADNREFRLTEPVKEEDSDSATRKYLNDKYGTAILDSGIELALQTVEGQEKNTGFLCFPDGSSSGPTMKFTLKKHTMKVRVSPLTGAVVREEVNND